MTDDGPDIDIAARKAALRRDALARRDALGADDRRGWDGAIARRALALPTLAGEGAVSAYWPMRSEVDPRPILEALHAQGRRLCLPAIVAGRILFRGWAPGEALASGGFGTQVPAPDAPPCAPAILLVPLAAFDRRGFRLGYGKGHYDRALTDLAPVLAIGLAYAAQEVPEVPVEPHDQPLDWIVTERGALSCR